MNHETAATPISGTVPSAAKRIWSTPEVRALKVENTELGSGYFGEFVGMNGCTIYDANAATNVCVVT